MTRNRISLNDYKHGIIRVPADIRAHLPPTGKCTVTINGTPRTVNRCRDMITGLGKLYKEAGITGETSAAWSVCPGTVMLTFCAGDGVPDVADDPDHAGLTAAASSIAAASVLDTDPAADAYIMPPVSVEVNGGTITVGYVGPTHAIVNPDSMKRDELRTYAKSIGIERVNRMSLDELRQAVKNHNPLPMFDMGGAS